MSSTHYVWVHYGDPYDSRWHACTVLRHLLDGKVKIELEPDAPPVADHTGLDGLGHWPGPGVHIDWRNGTWVPFPAPEGWQRPEPQPEVGTRTIVVPAELVHSESGDISTGWHPSYAAHRRAAHAGHGLMRRVLQAVRP